MARPPVPATFMHHLTMELLLAGSTLPTLDFCLDNRLLICTVNDFGRVQFEILRYICSNSTHDPPQWSHKLFINDRAKASASTQRASYVCSVQAWLLRALAAVIFFTPTTSRPTMLHIQCDTFIPLLPPHPPLVFGGCGGKYPSVSLHLCSDDSRTVRTRNRSHVRAHPGLWACVDLLH